MNQDGVKGGGKEKRTGEGRRKDLIVMSYAFQAIHLGVRETITFLAFNATSKYAVLRPSDRLIAMSSEWLHLKTFWEETQRCCLVNGNEKDSNI